ncbi:MAG: 5-(carboxyamino)imidazole ribonucleotide synthase, partial [Ramlibacter sp.]|uniref:5-(carboxyamino)imidazole ribonucleotide synthase n=1 Tax=Ramlibacter sp. TaxID=1917967 RepID=UPI002632BF8F
MSQHPPAALLPGATLGVMGGGQLGRMFVHAAQRLGYFTAVLDPDATSPAGRVSHHHLHADYLDTAALAELVRLADAITTEFENVPAQALAQLAAHRPVAPGGEAVAIAQDRALEKAHFTRCGVPCAPHALIESPEQLAAVGDALLPGILKTARLGYDGKGQARVANRTELLAAWQAMQSGNPPHATVCVLEKMLPLAAECSVVLARGQDGQMVHLPVQANLHRDGILAVTEVGDGALDPALASQALAAAREVAQGLDYVGVLCVEFFVLQPVAPGGQPSLVVNEIAPRPHNSGHHSIDSSDVSQFDLQVRCMAGLPLVPPRAHSAAVML